MVADKVVDHFQLVKKLSFVEGLPPEIKPDGVENFLVLNPGKVSFLDFFGVFFEAGDTFDNKPEARQSGKHYGVQSDAPSNGRRDDGFARHDVANRCRRFKNAKKPGIAPMLLVVKA